MTRGLKPPRYLNGSIAAIVTVALWTGACAALVSAQPSGQQPEQQEQFLPIEELPPQDQLPAAPLLVTAYAFVALALFGYVLSVARRLAVVQRELERLESDVKGSRRT